MIHCGGPVDRSSSQRHSLTPVNLLKGHSCHELFGSSHHIWVTAQHPIHFPTFKKMF